jgi:hypothetical protein
MPGPIWSNAPGLPTIGVWIKLGTTRGIIEDESKILVRWSWGYARLTIYGWLKGKSDHRKHHGYPWLFTIENGA